MSDVFRSLLPWCDRHVMVQWALTVNALPVFNFLSVPQLQQLVAKLLGTPLKRQGSNVATPPARCFNFRIVSRNESNTDGTSFLSFLLSVYLSLSVCLSVSLLLLKLLKMLERRRRKERALCILHCMVTMCPACMHSQTQKPCQRAVQQTPDSTPPLPTASPHSAPPFPPPWSIVLFTREVVFLRTH